MIRLIKKLGKVTVGAVFIIYAFLLFSKAEYGWGALLLISLLPLLKLNALTDLAFNISDGLRAKFQISPEKIEENIKENKKPITNQNFASFKHVETKILSELQKRYRVEMKTLVHFMYGQPDKPEFRYTPDGSLQTKDTLYFFEIKYVLKPEFAENIVKSTIKYLSEVYSKFLPSIGDKKFVIKLVLASGYDLSQMKFETPQGIEIEFFRV